MNEYSITYNPKTHMYDIIIDDVHVNTGFCFLEAENKAMEAVYGGTALPMAGKHGDKVDT